jgi:hypothetical protein
MMRSNTELSRHAQITEQDNLLMKVRRAFVFMNLLVLITTAMLPRCGLSLVGNRLANTFSAMSSIGAGASASRSDR